MSQKIITRFAPSPTGSFHVGSARTALFSFLYAKANGGEFKVRIEDTDKERSDSAHTKDILEALEWLGIEYDGEISTQSEHLERHREVLKKMIKDGFAFEGEESQSGNGKIIRFKNPNKEVTFTDLVRGDITFDTTDLGDFVMAKNIDEPLFHLAVVVDDADLGVTHIIRGEDHISNTPRQILIREAMGAPAPKYAHIPLILGSDRSKLSKRKHGAEVSVTAYKEKGYVSSALVNYLALLGWNPGGDLSAEEEIMSLEDLISKFDISRVQKGGAVFSEEKLDWFNREYLLKLSENDKVLFFKEYFPAEISAIESIGVDIVSFINISLERNSTAVDLRKSFDEGEFDYALGKIAYEKEALLWKKNPDLADTAVILNKNIELLETIPDNEFKHDKIKSVLWSFAEERGKGEVLWPTRVALSGKEKSPDPFTLADLLGKKITIERLKKAEQLLTS
jgi:glutamyl-tRNA synthetase